MPKKHNAPSSFKRATVKKPMSSLDLALKYEIKQHVEKNPKFVSISREYQRESEDVKKFWDETAQAFKLKQICVDAACLETFYWTNIFWLPEFQDKKKNFQQAVSQELPVRAYAVANLKCILINDIEKQKAVVSVYKENSSERIRLEEFRKLCLAWLQKKQTKITFRPLELEQYCVTCVGPFKHPSGRQEYSLALQLPYPKPFEFVREARLQEDGPISIEVLPKQIFAGLHFYICLSVKTSLRWLLTASELEKNIRRYGGIVHEGKSQSGLPLAVYLKDLPNEGQMCFVQLALLQRCMYFGVSMPTQRLHLLTIEPASQLNINWGNISVITSRATQTRTGNEATSSVVFRQKTEKVDGSFENQSCATGLSHPEIRIPKCKRKLEFSP